ncbi:hypothetical protein AFLA_006939 [Aspergillus flavus NRRL3357]|nr:hypothetical protein AFLA_006939 [Aspergillus flavus NRRL3357]
MAPLSKSKSYTDLITSMGVGDSEPDEERILTTLARHMAKVGVFESGLTKHMNQNGRATSSGSLPTATKSLLLTIQREGEVRNIRLDFSEESRRVKIYLEDKRQGNQLQRSTGNADNPGLEYDEFLHEIKRSMLFEPEEEEVYWYSSFNGKASNSKREPSSIVLSWTFTSALHHIGCLDGQPPDQDAPYTFYIQPKLDRNAGCLGISTSHSRIIGPLAEQLELPWTSLTVLGRESPLGPINS